jgi:hypothetical protein
MSVVNKIDINFDCNWDKKTFIKTSKRNIGRVNICRALDSLFFPCWRVKSGWQRVQIEKHDSGSSGVDSRYVIGRVYNI